MTTVVEDRHRKRIAASHHLLVDNCGGKLQRRLIAIHIILLVALNTDARVPVPVGDRLEKGVPPAILPGGTVISLSVSLWRIRGGVAPMYFLPH